MPIDPVELLDQAHTALVNLLRQHGCQEDMEEAGRRGSYPSEFPVWEPAWEQGREVMWRIEKHLLT